MNKFDFGGYATRNDLQCSDGRTIRKDAFKHNDGQTVPLVWQHMHHDPANVLGHALLENREDGVYAYCKFNETEAAKTAKELVMHKDITNLSIYANQLKQKGSDVLHGAIREVSLVLSGANPGAWIDNLAIEHSDGSYEPDESEAIIYSGLPLDEGAEEQEEEKELDKKQEDLDLKHEGGGETVEDIFNTLSDVQKNVVYFMIGSALEDAGVAEHSDEGGSQMKKNVFDNMENQEKHTLSHSDMQAILADAQKCGSLKSAFMAHAQTYGIENIDLLFPDAQSVTPTPDWIKRETSWVDGVLNSARHTPFSRIKSLAADITADEARAKGYVTGAEKTEEVFSLLSRVTYPTTIYKKQKLDRDDLVDITDMDVVAWLRSEMRLMLNEELARAALVSDGRAANHADKIPEANIRPIWKDADLYSHKVEFADDDTILEIIEGIMRASENYKGSGNPTLYTTTSFLNDMLLVKDGNERRYFNTEAELCDALRVSKIVQVPVMSNLSRTIGTGETAYDVDLKGIIVNLNDYVFGADKGGEVNMFDDFDIDYNQYKYLIETRCSGALIHPKSALVIEQKQAVVQG